MPVDPDTFTPHFETCPDSDKFRKSKRVNPHSEEIASSTPDVARPTDPLRDYMERHPMPEEKQRELF